MNVELLKKKATSAVFWNLSGTLMKQGISFVISIFLARLLSPNDFGLVGMATVFIALTQSFTDFGMTSGLIQLKNPSQVQYNTVFYINLLLAIFLTLLMISFSDLIGRYYRNPAVGEIAKFISVSFILNAINGVQNAQLTKTLANRIKTFAILASVLATGIVGIILAYLNFGVWSLIYATLIGNIVSAAYIWYSSNWRPSASFDFSEVKPLLNFGSKMFVSNLIESIYSKLDVLIIGKLFSPTTLGYYFRALSLNQLVTKYTSGALQGVFFPVISHLQNDSKEQLKVIMKSLHVISFLTFLIMGFLYLSADEVFILLFTDKWSTAIGYFEVMVFYSYAYPISAILVNILSGNGHSGKFLKLELWKKATGILAILVGFYYGIYGFLWGSVIASTIAVLINMIYVNKVVELSVAKQFKTVYQYAFASVVTVIFIKLSLEQINTNVWSKILLESSVFFSFYFLLCAMFKFSGFIYFKGVMMKRIYNL